MPAAVIVAIVSREVRGTRGSVAESATRAFNNGKGFPRLWIADGSKTDAQRAATGFAALRVNALGDNVLTVRVLRVNTLLVGSDWSGGVDG